MKKVTFIIAMCISMLAYSSPPEQIIGITIEFGKPRRNCEGFGICKIHITFDIGSLFESGQNPAEDGTGYGYASATETSSLQVKLVKKYMTDATLSKYFVRGKFMVEEDYQLPDQVIDALNLPPGYKIRKGIYNYTENTNEIIINL